MGKYVTEIDLKKYNFFDKKDFSNYITLVHGSPYFLKNGFKTLSHFNSECLKSCNGGIIAHYFYFADKNLSRKDEFMKKFVVENALAHACQKNGIRGAKGTTGYLYFIKMPDNDKRILNGNLKSPFDLYLDSFVLNEFKFIELKIMEKIYDTCKNNYEIIKKLSNYLLRKYKNYDSVGNILKLLANGLILPGFTGTMFIWNNKILNNLNIYHIIKANKIGDGSSIENYQFTVIKNIDKKKLNYYNPNF